MQKLAYIYLILASFSGFASAEESLPPLLGSFEGPLVIGRANMNLAFTFSEQNGEPQAAIISSGLGIYGLPAEYFSLEGVQLLIRIPQLDAEYTGVLRLNDAGEEIIRIDGEWFQSAEMVPVVLLPIDTPTL